MTEIKVLETVEVEDLEMAILMTRLSICVVEKLEQENIYVNQIAIMSEMPVSFITFGTLVVDEDALIRSIELHSKAGLEFDVEGYAKSIVDMVMHPAVNGTKLSRDIIDSEFPLETNKLHKYQDAILGLKRAIHDLSLLGHVIKHIHKVEESEETQVLISTDSVFIHRDFITTIFDTTSLTDRSIALSDTIVSLAVKSLKQTV